MDEVVVVLQTNVRGGDWSHYPEYAILYITPQTAETYLKRFEKINELRGEESDKLYTSVYCISYWDYIDFVDACEIIEKFCYDPDTNEYWIFYDKEVQKEIATTIDSHGSRVDCITQNVCQDSCYWTAYPKHTSLELETRTLRKADVVRIKRRIGDAVA